MTESKQRRRVEAEFLVPTTIETSGFPCPETRLAFRWTGVDTGEEMRITPLHDDRVRPSRTSATEIESDLLWAARAAPVPKSPHLSPVPVEPRAASTSHPVPSIRWRKPSAVRSQENFDAHESALRAIRSRAAPSINSIAAMSPMAAGLPEVTSSPVSRGRIESLRPGTS